MKKTFALTWLALLFMGSLSSAQSTDVFSTDLRVITFNIRYNNPADGEHAWPNRKEQVASVIRFHQTDLLGMQEVLRGQVDDLVSLLPEYSWLGVGRDDGEDKGEFSPIFYRTDRFELRDSGTFWLSESPEVVASKSWDAALTRIATWAKLTDLSTGTDFLFLNTHFDHRGEQARTHSASLIIQQVNQLAGGEPVIVTGDFNVPPTTEAYAVMTSELKDSRLQSQTEPHGPQGTFGGFVVGATPNTRRIDYIFVSDSIIVTRHAVLSDQIDGNYPSDHLPVLSEVRL